MPTWWHGFACTVDGMDQRTCRVPQGCGLPNPPHRTAPLFCAMRHRGICSYMYLFLACRDLCAVAAAIADGLPLSESPTHAALERFVLEEDLPLQTQQLQQGQQQQQQPNAALPVDQLVGAAASARSTSPASAPVGIGNAAAGSRALGAAAGSCEEERAYQVTRPSTLPASRTWGKAGDAWPMPSAGGKTSISCCTGMP